MVLNSGLITDCLLVISVDKRIILSVKVKIPSTFNQMRNEMKAGNGRSNPKKPFQTSGFSMHLEAFRLYPRVAQTWT